MPSGSCASAAASACLSSIIQLYLNYVNKICDRNYRALGYADPSEAEGDETQKLEAFRLTLLAIRRRLDLLTNLPPDKLERAMVQQSAPDLSRA